MFYIRIGVLYISIIFVKIIQIKEKKQSKNLYSPIFQTTINLIYFNILRTNKMGQNTNVINITSDTVLTNLYNVYLVNATSSPIILTFSPILLRVMV